MFKRIPYHPFVFAAFPILALLAYNIQETYPAVAVRPLLISLAGASILFILLRALLRDWQRAAVGVTLFLILFYAYGHLYYLLKDPLGGVILGRHRLLGPVFGVVLGLGLWLVSRKIKDPLPLTGFLNLVGSALVFISLFQVASYSIRSASLENAQASPGRDLVDPGASTKPDIYYIILDTYTRADSLKDIFDYDNTPFLDELRSLGFYVAECSRSNYRSTLASLASALNLDYLPRQDSQGSGRNEPADGVEMIQQNLVKSDLRSLGYKIVAFRTGYRWDEWWDADYFLQPSRFSAETGTIDPFESILINTTALRLVADMGAGLNRAAGRQIVPDFDAGPYQAHVQKQLFLLDQLEKIPSIPGPKFVFAHGLITHSPLVFNADGSISKTPCEYGQDLQTEAEMECLRKNYTNAVTFTNTRMLQIVRSILANSSTPPVIILQGDHGVQHLSQYHILNAYFLPEGARQGLYPTISPVNSFRLVFNEIFGADYPLLPDHSYSKQNYVDSVPEESAACISP